MKRLLIIIATSLVVCGFSFVAVAALTGGVTTWYGMTRVCDGSDGACPTGATATADGDLLVEDAIECDGAGDVGTTLAVGGITTPAGGIANAEGTTLTVGQPSGVHTGDGPAVATTDGFNATPVTTEIYYASVFVPFNMTVTGIAVFNGTVASDDWHRALLDVDGALVTGSATGAVTSSGTDVYQKVPFTGGAITVLGPATYYIAGICDGTTDRYNAIGEGTAELGFSTSTIAGKITGQTYGAIPATNTLALTFTTDLGLIASLY